MPIGILFHHYVLIIFIIVMRKRVNNYPGTYWEKVKLTSKKLALVLVIPALFDIYHIYLVINPEKLDGFYKEYQTLDREVRNDFNDCLLGSGPFGSIICPKLFTDKESLLKPTEKNLPGRLAKCNFGNKPRGRLFFETDEICLSALKDLSYSNDKEKQKKVFDVMVEVGNTLSCEKKSPIAKHFMKFLTMMKHEVKVWRFENYLYNDCYILFDSFNYAVDPFFHKYFESTFSKIDFSIYEESKLLYFKGLLISIKLYFHLSKVNNDRNRIPIHVDIFREYLVDAHEAEKIDTFIKNIKIFLEAEEPEIAKDYPYHLLRDKSWLNDYSR